MKSHRQEALSIALGASALLLASGARAANPPCNAIPLPDGGTSPTVYVGGSTASQPFVQAISQALLPAANPVRSKGHWPSPLTPPIPSSPGTSPPPACPRSACW